MPVTTRSKARSGRTPDLVASLEDGATNCPKRYLDFRQDEAEAEADVEDPADPASISESSPGNHFAAGYAISKCLRRRCMICPKFIASTEIVPNITKKTFSTINHSNKTITCDSQTIVCLLTCSHCNTQYVRETTNPLRKRINIHRTAKSS